MTDFHATQDITDHLALALVPGLGPKLTAALLARFGSAGNALRATAAELREIPHIGETLASALAQAFRTVTTAPEFELLQKHAVRAVPLGFPGYPPPLARVPGPPPLLYFRGDWKPEDVNAVGIVGSRSCTSYGLKVAGQLARELVRAGFTIISGLARGIDAAAHRGALEAGGRTIAVLAGGLSKIYPPEHSDMAAEIVADRGCLLTESSMRMEPQPGMFPARNRIISGLSRAVIIVEANARSGAIITAQHAAEQGREVYAVPGPIDSPASAGCLELIRNGARLVRSADDVIEDLKGLSAAQSGGNRSQESGDRRQETRIRRQGTGDGNQETGKRDQVMSDGARREENHAAAQAGKVAPEEIKPAIPELSAIEKRAFEALAARRHADELARELSVPVSELSRALMLLELKKLVRRMPGNFYERR